MVAKDGVFIVFIQQLIAQSPVLLAHDVGLILSIIWIRRCPAPAMFCLSGCGLTIFVAILFSCMNAWMQESRMIRDVPAEDLFTWMRFASIVSMFLRAIGAGLIIAAVFVRRSPTAPSNQLLFRPYTAPSIPEESIPRVSAASDDK